MDESKFWHEGMPSKFLEIWARTQDDGYVPRILITSNRHQMAKTSTMIRIMEKVQEEVNGRKYHKDDCTLTTLEYVRRRKAVPEWTPCGLDEPTRGGLSNKKWMQEEAQIFVQDLVATAFRHTPFLSALPHSHFLNNEVYGVSTSLIVKESKGIATLYELWRDQLNRGLKTGTRNNGSFHVDYPYAWDWNDYMEKREAFDSKVGKINEEKLRSLELLSVDLTKEQVYQIVLSEPEKYRNPKTKEISYSEIEAELGVSAAMANYAATRVKRFLRNKEKAEEEA